jgi:undecaprenyl-diphosphatase
LDVTEDTIGGDSGPIDAAILGFVHRHVPSTLHEFFAAVTLTGSWAVLVPLTIFATLALALAKYRYEALLLFATPTISALVVYVVKAVVGRDRPALWATDLYWGSSFPSGHTLVVASFATAACLCVNRIRPAMHRYAAAIALVWVFLVAMSRLIIGVHWPTDVLAAACIGAFIPLAISLALAIKEPG